MASLNASGVLRGIRVLDFGHYTAGPLTGMLLADQGAEVIKIERPGGDPARASSAFAIWNRGKKSIVIDLKRPEGLERAIALIQSADIVIENFRPGVMERLGLGYETLAEKRPELIYCAMPGFGEGHPFRARQGWEGIVGATTGLYQPSASQLPASEIGGTEEPHFTPLPIASTFAAMLGSVSIAMALLGRSRSRHGQRIEVPLYNAVFTAMGRVLIRFKAIQPQSVFDWPRNVMSRNYLCADGRYVQHHGITERFLRQTLAAAGKHEWYAEAHELYGREVDADVLALWIKRFSGMFALRSAQEWEDAISAQGGACTVNRSIDEWLSHPHAKSAGLVSEVNDATLGPMKQPGLQVNLQRTPGRIRGGAPKLDVHARDVIANLGSKIETRQGRRQSTDPALPLLNGVRVLDLCVVLAGPSCGRTLSEFGAEVIKIDDPTRCSDPEQYVDVNRGKRSIQLNLKTEKGRSIFWRMVATADVILENFRPGTLRRLGLGFEAMRARNAAIILASMSCYGQEGIWQNRPGWEQSAQAATGFQVRHGGRRGKPRLVHYPVNDYGTGLMGAYAVALALMERRQSKQGQWVDTSLASTAGLLQSPFFMDYPGMQRCEPEGPQSWGWLATSRLYRCSDGWIYIHCADQSTRDNLIGLLGPDMEVSQVLSDSSTDIESSDSLARALSDLFRTQSCSYWQEKLDAIGISAARSSSLDEIRNDPYVRASGLIVTRPHVQLGEVEHLGTTVKLTGVSVRLGTAAPRPGEHTKEILRELGYSEPEITEFLATGVVVKARDWPAS